MNVVNSIAVVVMSGCLAGCASPGSAEGPVAAGEASASQVTLPRGASGQAVREALGQPTTVDPVKDNPAAEIWTYRRPIRRRMNTIEVQMEDRLVFDPTNLRTGMGSVRVPVSQMQEVITEEILVLLMEDGRMMDWRFRYEERPSGPVVR